MQICPWMGKLKFHIYHRNSEEWKGNEQDRKCLFLFFPSTES